MFVTNNKINFCGTPERLYQGVVRDYHDALSVWERLKSAKYLDVHSDTTSPYNKIIRQENYSFLDKLNTVFDKSQFIRRFCEFTKFPNLAQISQNMDTTFQNCLQNVSSSLGSSCYNVIDAGYDTTCSLGLRKAFPGSDLDKGYIIIEGNHPFYSEERVVNEFKGGLWNNLDQRIVSLNHPDTYPDVYTKKQVVSNLEKMDSATYQLFFKQFAKNKLTFWGILSTAFNLPFSLVNSWIKINQRYPDAVNNPETDPYEAATFNRALAERLPVREREDAKNFAFFIEIVLANLRKFPKGKTDALFSDVRASIFAKKSNVTQNSAWQTRIDNGYMKTKLRRREQLQRDFGQMDIVEKYELVKDIIKSSSNDQSSRFAQFFTNDDDISDRYQRLLRSLK